MTNNVLGCAYPQLPISLIDNSSNSVTDRVGLTNIMNDFFILKTTKLRESFKNPTALSTLEITSPR